MDGLFHSTTNDCTGNFEKQMHGQPTKPQGHLAPHATCLICLHWVKKEEQGGQRPRGAQRYPAGLNGLIKPPPIFHFSLNGVDRTALILRNLDILRWLKTLGWICFWLRRKSFVPQRCWLALKEYGFKILTLLILEG